jgi:hypothetical protein
MDYPDWAPERPSSIEVYKLAADGTRVNLKLPDRLLTDLRMERVWRTLKRRANKPNWEGRFIEAVCIFFTGPRDFDTLSNREAVEKGMGIIATARALRAMLDDIEIDYTFGRLSIEDCPQGGDWMDNLWREYEKCGGVHATGTLLDLYNDLLYHFERMIFKDIKESLAMLEEEIEQEIQQERILVRPHHKNAHLHYFLRKLTKYMRLEFGKALRQAVADTATVVFDLPKPLTKEDIARLAP